MSIRRGLPIAIGLGIAFGGGKAAKEIAEALSDGPSEAAFIQDKLEEIKKVDGSQVSRYFASPKPHE